MELLDYFIELVYPFLYSTVFEYIIIILGMAFLATVPIIIRSLISWR